MKLLVASVFSPSDRNPVWYALQRQFLGTTTDVPFTHALFLNGVDPAPFTNSQTIGVAPGNLGHVQGLEQIVDYFHRNEEYTHLLVLDSDAWPVCPKWATVLTRLMERHGKHAAAPLRFENLDTFPHPCAMFLDRREIGLVREWTTQPCKNLLWKDVVDVGTHLWGDLNKFLPLLRSNRQSPHPVFGAVYGHIFYHHGAGSREPVTRSMLSGMYAHYIEEHQHAEIEGRLFEELVRDPHRLMSRLTGTPL